MLFTVDKNLVFTNRNKELAEEHVEATKCASTWKAVLLAAVDCFLRKWKKMVPLARRSVTLVKGRSFFKNWLLLIWVTVSISRNERFH